MNNNVNSNVGNVPTVEFNPAVGATPVNNFNPNVATSSNVNVSPNVVNTNNVTDSTVVIPSVNTGQNCTAVPNNVVNNQDGIASNTYVIVGSIVGVILLGSVLLLVLLVTGVIGNRNRMTCTKITNESGYVYTEKRVYKFDKGLYTEINKTFIFNYTNLTDDMYNQEFAAILDNNSGVSSYGFDTKISRAGNIVTITAYEPRYFDKTRDDIETSSVMEGFTCE